MQRLNPGLGTKHHACQKSRAGKKIGKKGRQKRNKYSIHSTLCLTMPPHYLIVIVNLDCLRRPKPFQKNVIGHLSLVIGEKRKT
jgi:hypothetical protein